MDLNNFLDENLGELEISKELQNLNKNDFVVSYDFTSLHPSAQIDKSSNWPKIEAACPFREDNNESICSLFNCRR